MPTEKTKPPFFDIQHFKDNLDGTSDMEIEVTDEFVEYYKKMTGKKRATKKGLEIFMRQLVYDITQGEPS